MHAGDHAKTGMAAKVRSGASWVLVIGAGVLIAALFRSFVGTAYAIPSGSMEGTLNVGDRVFSEKITYAMGESPQQGDIVTFVDPADPARTLVKRVVATEGQTVELRDGSVYVDGAPLDEPYTEGRPSFPLTSKQGADIAYPFTVPEGSLWVMGDNRTNSSDSRSFGAVPVSSVTGKVVFRSWPLTALGPF